MNRTGTSAAGAVRALTAEPVDVLVLGAGQAGFTAAIAAAQAGARVAVLEKRDIIGGSTAMSSGLTAYAGTDEQAAAGVHDSTDLLRDDILAVGHHLNDPDLVEVYCREQLVTYRWLKSLGIRYTSLHAASGQSVPRSHGTDPSVMVDTLARRAEDLGVRLLHQVRAVQLLTDATDDEGAPDRTVCGVLVEVHGSLVELHAKAVVLATGGFSRNPDLLAKFVPHMADAVSGGAPGSEGDGLLMGWALGADFRDVAHVKGTFGIYPLPDVREGGTGILAVYKGAIAVNAEGRRFCDESLPYKVLGDHCLRQPGHVAWQVFDATTMAHDDPHVDIYWFSARANTGLLVSADTLPGLAEKIGLPADTLGETVERYNAACAAQQPDEFGRAHLVGAVGAPAPVAAPPFYAHLSTASVLATYAGLTVDAACRVQTVFGDPVPGLYAAGEVMGGFHGDGYMTGTSVGKAGIFGRVAGLAAAEYVGLTVDETTATAWTVAPTD